MTASSVVALGLFGQGSKRLMVQVTVSSKGMNGR